MEKEIESLVAKPAEDPIKETKENSIEEFIEEFIEKPPKEFSEESMERFAEKLIEEIKEERKEDLKDEVQQDKIRKHKKIAMSITTFLCIVLVIYFGMAKYYISHFYFGTEINGVNVSGKTLEYVEEIMKSELQVYALNLIGLEDEIQVIKADEIGLQYSSDEEFKKLKEAQKSYKWILGYFNKDSNKVTVEFLFDEVLLRERINNLSCFNRSDIREPKNPSFKYANNGYVIIDEVFGYKVDKDIVYSNVAATILNGQTEIDLKLLAQLIEPKYNSNSKKVIKVRDTLNKYVSSTITYDFGHSKKFINGSIINKWLIVDENFEVTFDEENMKIYINKLFNSYNTIGNTREFSTSSGETIKIDGGDYGWSINQTKEAENLISAIKEGITITIEPEYSQTAFSHGINDIGDTYVEIDLEKQHIWFYKGGSLVVEGDIVTGNVNANHTTPKGIYRLKYKTKNVVLRGPGYASPVTFWMPFNGGIGIHDASWRSKFGGDIYLNNGSHGCINSPYNVAKEIFDNIEPGTPVICY